MMAALPAAAAGHAHAHGLARLEVVVESRSISVHLASPLDNLVGFERAPRSASERQRVDSAVARLRAGDELLVIDPAAQCRLSRAVLSSGVLGLGQPEGGHSDHADLDARYEFACVDAGLARHIDVKLFQFERLKRLDAEVASPTGQLKRRLSPRSTQLPLSR